MYCTLNILRRSQTYLAAQYPQEERISESVGLISHQRIYSPRRLRDHLGSATTVANGASHRRFAD